MAVAASSRRRAVLPAPEGAQPDWLTRRRSLWLLAGIVVLGAAIRFSTLDQQSFWLDEATTWGIVSHSLGHVLSTVPKTESTPPLYYVLVWLWAQLFGTGEVGLRSFSALCGTLTIPAMWEVGRRLASERIGLVAALVTAVNPLLFWYSQEARTYALLALLSALSLVAFLRALEQPSRGRLLAWGSICALTILAHYFGAFIVAGEAVWLAWALHRRGSLTAAGAVAGLAPIVVVGAALVPLVIRQNDGRASFISTASGSLPYRLGQLVKQDILGDGQPWKALLLAIGLVLVALALVLLVTRATRRERDGGVMMLVIGAGGVVLAFVVAAVVTDYFDTRNLLATWPALALVVAVGFGAARAGPWGAVGLAGLVVLSLVCIANVVRDPDFQRDNWRGAVQALGTPTTARAIVADGVGAVTLQPYLHGASAYPPAGAPVREVDMIWLGRSGYGHPLLPVAPVALGGFQRQEIRTKSYVVVRYRAATATPVPFANLRELYPVPARAQAYLQP
ncbi:MAG TPA: glycosyltransferase family 39 protein [Solirubrobacteraceae bacterium]|jgi:4-amino-4-deoxy-L-arabinose transferase-like glycosyltransferase|nr:glycosyltransferase family 39 protein [Solirubrobacteraceae bacterium]